MGEGEILGVFHSELINKRYVSPAACEKTKPDADKRKQAGDLAFYSADNVTALKGIKSLTQYL